MSTPTAESSHRVRGLRNIDVDGPGQPALVFEQSDRRLRQRGDRVRSDQAVDLAGVGIGGIPGTRRGPQRPLATGAEGSESFSAWTREPVAEPLIGQLGLRHRRPAPKFQRLLGAGRLDAMGDVGVHPTDKNEATPCTVEGSPPAATNLPSPDR
jgi:hypothetical protein